MVDANANDNANANANANPINAAFIDKIQKQPSSAREVVIASASKPADPNEETLHWLRCVELGKTVYPLQFQVSSSR